MFIIVMSMFLLLSLSFTLYQHSREREYRIEILHHTLQAYNESLLQSFNAVPDKKSLSNYISLHPISGLRITILDLEGNVITDSEIENPLLMGNHLNRKEIVGAIAQGVGYDVKRESETLSTLFFYSATLSTKQNCIIRAALPYNSPQIKVLQTDNSYILYAIAFTLVMGIILFHYTNRIGSHISYLKMFASKAERGERLDADMQRRLPHDELGDISNNIIQLYWRLKQSEEDKLRLKRQLTQNAAHELKTPATSIQGYLETILSTPDIDAERCRHFLERCYAQSKRMSSLLQDMSILNRLDEGKNNYHFTENNLLSIINNVADDTALELEKSCIELRVEVCKESTLQADTSLLYSIFRNLIDNAISYAQGATYISIKATSKDYQTLSITVSDNGIGVEAQHLPHLFERFYRTDKGRSRQLGGTGLGLAIVKHAVAAHGGEIRALPTEGGGLTIQFTLKRKGRI